MKTILTFFSFCLVILFSFKSLAQPTLYSKVLYTDSANVTASAACKTLDGSIVIAGEYESKPFLCKIDSLSNILWNVRLGNTNSGGFRSLALTKDSGFLAAGYIFQGLVSAFVARFNQWGDTLWTTMTDTLNEAWSVDETFDNGAVICGPSYVTKLDSTGNIEWSNSYMAGNNFNWIFDCKQTPDSGYIVTGYMENFPPFDANAIIYKLSSSGSILWSQKYNLTTPDFCFGLSIDVIQDGFICLVSCPNYGLVVKTDFNGTPLWTKRNPFPGNGNCINCGSAGIHPTNDKGFLLYSNGNVLGESWAEKIDSTGNSVWTIQPQLMLRDIVEDNEGIYTLVGNGPLQGFRQAFPMYSHIGIVKTDSLANNTNCAFGTVLSTSADTVVVSPVTVNVIPAGSEINATLTLSNHLITVDPGCVVILPGIESPENDALVRIFPNPAADRINFSFGEHEGKYLLSVYSPLGQLVFNRIVSGEESDFSIRAGFSAGIYTVVISNDSFVSTKKLVIQ